MNRAFLAAILSAAALISCATETGAYIPAVPEERETETAAPPRAFVIIDHQNSALGGNLPAWVSAWLESGSRGIETIDAYRDRYAFISQSEGSNFNAMNLRLDGFSAELDFPRMAASRIEARLGSGVSRPDTEYGAFFETLIRAASDAAWHGMTREDTFWIKRRFEPTEDESAKEEWVFLIFVSIEKKLFEAQMNSIFGSIQLNPPPLAEQAASIAQIKARFFDGF